MEMLAKMPLFMQVGPAASVSGQDFGQVEKLRIIVHSRGGNSDTTLLGQAICIWLFPFCFYSVCHNYSVLLIIVIKYDIRSKVGAQRDPELHGM